MATDGGARGEGERSAAAPHPQRAAAWRVSCPPLGRVNRAAPTELSEVHFWLSQPHPVLQQPVPAAVRAPNRSASPLPAPTVPSFQWHVSGCLRSWPLNSLTLLRTRPLLTRWLRAWPRWAHCHGWAAGASFGPHQCVSVPNRACGAGLQAGVPSGSSGGWAGRRRYSALPSPHNCPQHCSF
jgi:hypothetical protein